MSERIPCTNPDCSNTILPATAAANDGLCAPCMGEIARKEHEEYVRLNRRTVNQYEGLSDPVEMATIMLSARGYDPLIVYAPAPLAFEDLFGSLTASEVVRLAEVAKKAFESDNADLAEDIAKSLATQTDYDLTEMLRVWTARDHHWPAIAFRSAKAETRDAIIQSLTKGRANTNHALSALAWIGDDVVRKAFVEWDALQPAWALELYVPPSHYANKAGWEIVNNARRDLSHESCYALTQAGDGQSTALIKTFQRTGKACPWCGYELSNMLEIDISESMFAFLGFAGSKLAVLTCHGCTCYGRGFHSKIDGKGNAMPHPLGAKPEWLPDSIESWSDPAWRDVQVSLTPRRAIQAADWGMELKSSQIGGLPCWVQHSEYPKCLDCSATMRFIAQLNEDDFPENEGTYYAFLCESCRTTATSYQQT